MTDTIQWTLRGYKPSLIASPWFWVKHFNIIFLEPIGWMSANHLLVGLSSSLHFGGSWTTSVVQSTTVRILFLHVLIHGSLWRTYFPMNPLKIASRVVLLKTGQKHSTKVLFRSAQLHSWGEVALTLEVCVEESFTDGRVDGL